jgi:ribosome recycling factor
VVDDIILNADAKMHKATEGLKQELGTIRTGRATPALVEHIKVDYYDVPTPLNQVATINVPEARLIVIQPWDRSTLANIQKAILKSDLGLNPTNDGNVIRLVLSPPTEERRKELVKVIRKRLEDRKITIRNLRREALEELKNLEKNKEISQDELARVSNQLQKLTDGFIAEVDQMGQDKEAEIMEI